MAKAPAALLRFAAGPTAPYDLIIPTQETTWTAVLLAGLSFLRARGATHVFILLEDHVPLWPCDVDLLEDVCRIVAREDLSLRLLHQVGVAVAARK